jgi:hypothetical protein
MSQHPAQGRRIPRRALRGLGLAIAVVTLSILTVGTRAQNLEPVDVEGQPLAGNVDRLLKALDVVGSPLPADKNASLQEAIKRRDATKLQQLLDPQVLVVVTINPESRVKAKRGPAAVPLQQGGYTPIIIKVLNDSTVTKPLHVASPQAGPIFSGGRPTPAKGALKGAKVSKDNFLEVEMLTKEPMTDKLNGLKVEYALALIYSSEAGKREVTLEFDVGQGTQDLGFRGVVPILFDIRPALPVRVLVTDFDGKPTTGRFTFRDKLGHVYPPMAKRLAPDFFFQDQVYRHNGGTVLLPPGELTMTYGRGPEYYQRQKPITISEKGENKIEVKVERWSNPMDYGFYSGDHHIHAAGCAHYTNPTEGVFAEDMFLHVKGEGMNVGCNLTWGPCYDFQRQFFEPVPHKISERFTVLKYDIEVSGFGSQALGHVCLLNLRDQTYPGSEGTKTKGWPTWTTPLMKWAKAQGAYTGYAHSASGLTFDGKGVNARGGASHLIASLDTNKDGQLSAAEAAKGLLPDTFMAIDKNDDGLLTVEELANRIQQVKEVLPNHAIPPMNGIGAQEICVTTSQGLCDFISAMDTARVPEWNCWYHIMNCGLPLKASGETDFPCISGSRVGQGRVYVQLGKVDRIDFPAWAEGLAKGRSYVSDGYAHALQFTVDGKPAGDKVALASAGKVKVKARVAFAADVALGTAPGAQVPTDTTRLVEVVVNGTVAASKVVPADDKTHDLSFDVPITKSSWVALRHFPQMHTNPVNVIVDGKPIRASRKSALWCIGTIEQLWRERGAPSRLPITPIDAAFAPRGPDNQPRNPAIAPHEIDEAHRTFLRSIDFYRKIAAESPEGS